MTENSETEDIATTGAAPVFARRRLRRTRIVGLIVVFVVSPLGVAGWMLGSHSGPTRSELVFARGASVMPFDQSKTTHVFETTMDGGVQTVTVNDPSDLAQIDLVRGHLRQSASRFSEGDFSNPAAIHGKDMPGLAELARGTKSISITYDTVLLGGRITYSTNDPALVPALHAWFAAQTSDHDMSHNHMHS